MAALDAPVVFPESSGLIGGGGGSEVLGVEAAVSSQRHAVAFDHVGIEHLAFVGGQEPILGQFLVVRVLRVGVGRAEVSVGEKRVSYGLDFSC